MLSRISHLKRVVLLAALVTLASSAWGQSVWLETGFAYRDTATQSLSPGFKFGLRGVFDLTDTVGLYVAPYYLGGFGVDGGVWFSFPVGLNDVEGLTSYLGTGLTVVNGNFGLALSGALGYELSQTTEIVLVYTHRPLFLPRLSQAFDVSLGLKIDLR